MDDLTRPCSRSTHVMQYFDLDQGSILIRPWDCLTPLRRGPIEAAGSAPYTTMLLLQARLSGDHWHVAATGHGVRHHSGSDAEPGGLVRTMHLDTVLERQRPARALDMLRTVSANLCWIINETGDWEALGA